MKIQFKEEKLDICKMCDKSKINIVGLMICTICGCPLKAKTASKLFKCPEGKW